MKIWVFLAALAVSAPASAEVLDQAAARKALFSTKGHKIQLSDKLTATEQNIVKKLIPLMAKQLRQPVRYYAAIAYSPDDGLVHESLQAAMNHHTPAAARAAAVAACNPLRSKGKKKCTVAAQIVPKKYRPSDLTLSVDATAAFDKKYRKLKGKKAFAISTSTGAWAIGGTEAATIAACERAGSSGDCEIVIKDGG